MKGLTLFLAFNILLITLGVNILVDCNALSNFVCTISKDILESKNDTQDVMIGNLDRKTQPTIINDLVGCIGPSYPVVISEFTRPFIDVNLRKATVVILIFDKIFTVSMSH